MLILSNPEIHKYKEQIYFDVRNKEGRIISDVALLQLPYVASDHPYKKEWDLRAANFERLKNYLSRRFSDRQIKILDIGCGNGWMTHKLYEEGYDITGIDLNMEELKQAERTFGSSDTLQWVYADVINNNLPNPVYDAIIMSASCQYFSDIRLLTERLISILSTKGEIHLTDSIFYKQNERSNAEARSHTYYSNMGFSQMSAYYHHHTVEDLKKAGYTKIRRSIFGNPNPLQWWKLVKA